MIIKPRVRGFMCITAHPAGCAANVRDQIDYVRSLPPISGPKRVLVIGASTGYGLAARVTAAFGAGAATLGVFFEKPGREKKTATAGWYNSAAFHASAEGAGLYARSINGDAFSDSVKQRAIEAIRSEMGQVDLVIYSLASPRREHPQSGEVFHSTLKPIGKSVAMRGLNTDKGTLQGFSLEAANEKEINDTVAVMGGEDWLMWIEALYKAKVLAHGAKSTAFTYIGDKITWDLYWHGTIGRAKQDLDQKVLEIRQRLLEIGGDARVSVLKAVVTQASSAIPIMPLYLSLLFREMKARNSHEGCIEQIYRLFNDRLYNDDTLVDSNGRLRVDELELLSSVQSAVADAWAQINDENISVYADVKGYRDEFLKLFGFGLDAVDYEQDVDLDIPIAALL